MTNRVQTLMKISSIIGLSLAMLSSAKPASAQMPASGPAFPIPSVIDTGADAAQGRPACASSANGTGHMICVYGDSNNNLSAISVFADSG
jgi:hypothetical protein